MKYKKMLKQLKALLSEKEHQKKEQCDELRGLLKTLKQKEKSLKAKLEGIEDQVQREKLEKRIGIIHAQRKKGLKALKSMKHCQ